MLFALWQGSISRRFKRCTTLDQKLKLFASPLESVNEKSASE
jgi:hypothetical protein